MLIDWFTVCAQAINFLILVWLLRRFLYKPILDAIDKREKLIAKELSDAAAKKTEAKKERDEFERKNEELDTQRTSLINKATVDAKAQGKQLLDAAKADAETARNKLQGALKSEEESLRRELSKRTSQVVFAISRKTLKDLADAELEARMVNVLTARMHSLDAKKLALLKASLASKDKRAAIRSAFELKSAQRTEIESALKKVLGESVQLKFEAAPNLVSGIELVSNGHKLAWCIDDYLGELEQDVTEFMAVHAPPPANSP